jgi:hypothetical protein
MGYLKSTKKTTSISFNDIDFGTPTKEAEKMQREILAFFKENPDGEVKFNFGGYARLSRPFADALFEGGRLNKHMDNITMWGIHLFDEIILGEAESKHTEQN